MLHIKYQYGFLWFRICLITKCPLLSLYSNEKHPYIVFFFPFCFFTGYRGANKFSLHAETTHMSTETRRHIMHTQLWSLSPKTIAWRYSLAIRQSNTRSFFFPAATKHVTILLCLVCSETCQKMTEDRTFFPRVSALITAWLLALPRLYKCQSKVQRSLWKRVPQKICFVLIVRQQNIVIQNSCISGHPHHSRFFFLFVTSHVCCHYSSSISHFFNSPWPLILWYLIF